MNATSKHSLLLSFLASVVAIAGCSSNEPSEISAETTGYTVAESSDESSDRSKSTPQKKTQRSANPTDLLNQAEDRSSDTGEITVDESNTTRGPMNPDAMRTASSPGTRNSGALSALQLPTSDEPRDYVQFLAETDRALQGVMRQVQQQLINEEEYLSLSRQIADKKLAAAAKINKLANGDQKLEDMAILAQLQGLSQLASNNDPGAVEALENMAKQVAEMKSPELAHQAKIVLAGFAISNYVTGQNSDPMAIVDELKQLLAEKDQIGVADFQITQQSLFRLNQKGDQKAFEELKTIAVDAFVDSTNPGIASTTWLMMVDGSPEKAALDSATETLMSDDATIEPEAYATVVRDLVRAFPQEMTLAAITRSLFEIEYSGKVEHAKELAKVLEENKAILSELIKPDVESSLKSFNARMALIGETVDLSGLQTLDGQPFDAATLEGKVVLLDFWATWCGPCIREFPTMQRVYEKYRDDGFEIVGINLDEDLASVEQFQSDRKLPWMLVRSSDEKAVAFDTPAAIKMSVDAIPFLVLLGPDGMTKQLHVRGESLDAAVAELLGKDKP
jgi:thiol-disulfide isomerase/thioredoxin